MAITLHYRLDDKQSLAVRAETQITYEKDKIYRLVLDYSEKRMIKNPVLANDVLPAERYGSSAEVSYDYSLFNSKGVNLTPHAAHVCILPDPPPAESTAPRTGYHREYTETHYRGEEQTDDIHLFGTADCLDNIRLEQIQSFLCPAIGPPPRPTGQVSDTGTARGRDYTLLRFLQRFGQSYLPYKEGQKSQTIKWIWLQTRFHFKRTH